MYLIYLEVEDVADAPEESQKDVQKLNIQRVKKQEKAAESIREEDAHAAEEDAVKF